MKRLRRLAAALGATVALAVPAIPAVAQEAPATNSAAEVVGPPQLRDFSLNGTVTRQAEPTPAEPPARGTAPAATASRPAARPGRAEADRAPASAGQRPSPERSAAAAPASAGPASTAPAQSVTFDLPPATPVEQASLPDLDLTPADPLDSDTSAFALPGGGSIIPWLLAFILLGGGLWFLATRQRGRYAMAGGMPFDMQPEPEPAAPALPRAMPGKRPPPAAPPRSDGAIISTRLRPWIDIEFVPGRAVLNDQGATIEFEVIIRNTGAAPARDVLLEAAMFNAGPDQEQQIGAFFAHPDISGDRLQQILPLSQVGIRSAVSLSLDQMRQFEVAGRKLFVPLIAVNALYRWSAGDGQTSASYMIGRDGKGEKMAPFRLDLGPRIFRGLGARAHGPDIRK